MKKILKVLCLLLVICGLVLAYPYRSVKADSGFDTEVIIP